MVLGRMVFNFTTKAKILKINAWRFGLYFVLLDITAFLVQAVGAILASGSGKPPEQVKQGKEALQIQKYNTLLTFYQVSTSTWEASGFNSFSSSVSYTSLTNSRGK